MWARLRSLLRAGKRSSRSSEPSEAEVAVKAAEDDLTNALRRNTEVRKLAAELRYHREVNHFAERIRASMRGA